ncbi:MMPL family transporter [Lentilactobacillus sp. Marseille-Q4993]|uniref:MMPL family transporter n=1 Tax=Lentilactobacillus sp. Marseille-Q4993 TaxID=3039492 RepID=UPI0024BCB5AE|nr:MMPL family transporter [Lentilactobacillus sp. Marseille-Q4993]
MQNGLTSFGKWVYNNKFKALAAWLVMLIAFISTVGMLGSHFNENLKISGIPSTDIQKVLEKKFDQSVDAGSMTVVVENTNDKSINNSNQKKEINDTVKALKSKYSSQIKSITSPYESQSISSDKTTGMVSITFKKDSNLVSDKAIAGIQKKFRANVKDGNTKVSFSGNVLSMPDIGGLSEIIGIVIAFILMLVLFKSFITAGLPIISAVIGLVTGLMTIIIGTNFFSIVSIAQTLAVMVTLAVGIDYALFIIHRYKSELANSGTTGPDNAMGATLGSAGSSVLFAGVTVMIALVGLVFVRIDFLTQMGIASAVGVLFAVLSAMTLLPALISLFSKFIKPASVNTEQAVNKAGLVTRTVANHPVVMVIISLAVLIGFMIPTGHMRLGMPFDGALPTNNTRRQAYDTISDKFGAGANSTMIGVVKLDTNNSLKDNKKILKTVTDKIEDYDSVKRLMPVVNEKAVKEAKSPEFQQKIKVEGKKFVQKKVMAAMMKNPTMSSTQQKQLAAKYTMQFKNQVTAKMKKAAISSIPVKISDDHKYARFILMPKNGPESEKTEKLVQKINSYSKDLVKSNNTKITLTGTNAVNIDISKKLNNAIPLFTAIVMVIAFVLLMIMFRSFVIPLFAMIGFGLSVFASFGFTTLVMQDGVMKNLFGISVGAPILAFLPVVMIGVLFGLAMDYEVFMVSRIRETYLLTGDTKYAVKTGIAESGPVIVTAALIMIAVFGSFALSTDPTIKSIGIALAGGVLFDAFFVRLIFVPAMINLLGKVNWYFPGATHNKFKK